MGFWFVFLGFLAGFSWFLLLFFVVF